MELGWYDWMCSPENKNWTLFTALVLFVNDDTVMCEKVIMKYFESGHTWMAADSFHRSVEHGMKRRNTGSTINYPRLDKVFVAQFGNGINLHVQVGEHTIERFPRRRIFAKKSLLSQWINILFPQKNFHMVCRSQRKNISLLIWAP